MSRVITNKKVPGSPNLWQKFKGGLGGSINGFLTGFFKPVTSVDPTSMPGMFGLCVLSLGIINLIAGFYFGYKGAQYGSKTGEFIEGFNVADKKIPFGHSVKGEGDEYLKETVARLNQKRAIKRGEFYSDPIKQENDKNPIRKLSNLQIEPQNNIDPSKLTLLASNEKIQNTNVAKNPILQAFNQHEITSKKELLRKISKQQSTEADHENRIELKLNHHKEEGENWLAINFKNADDLNKFNIQFQTKASELGIVLGPDLLTTVAGRNNTLYLAVQKPKSHNLEDHKGILLDSSQQIDIRNGNISVSFGVGTNADKLRDFFLKQTGLDRPLRSEEIKLLKSEQLTTQGTILDSTKSKIRRV